MVLPGLHRDVRAAADLLVAASGRHPAEHLALARCERLVLAAIDPGVLAFELDDARHHRRGDLRRATASAGVSAANRPHPVGGWLPPPHGCIPPSPAVLTPHAD